MSNFSSPLVDIYAECTYNAASMRSKHPNNSNNDLLELPYYEL